MPIRIMASPRISTHVEVGADAVVQRTHGELAVIGARATVGPFSRLRPGTVLGEGGKIGSFVETKNAQIGAGSKVPHLTYCGDLGLVRLSQSAVMFLAVVVEDDRLIELVEVHRAPK